MRKQYHLKPTGNGFDAWDVDRLLEMTKNLPVREVELSQIREVDENFWYNGEKSVPTCRSIVAHMRLINETDLAYPVILSRDGNLMDGMHRVCKALLLGHNHIKAVQLEEDPPPDYTGIREEDLPYTR
jgi:hypothetical protein